MPSTPAPKPPKRPRPAPRAVLRGHGSPVTAVHLPAAATAKHLLLTGDEYGAVRLWDTRFEECVAVVVLDPAEPVLSILTDEHGLPPHTALVQLKGCAPRLLHIDRVATFRATLSSPSSSSSSSSASAATATATGAAKKQLSHQFWSSFCRVRPLGHARFVAGGPDGQLAVLSVAADGALRLEASHTVPDAGLVMGVSGGSDGTTCAAALESGSVVWWDTRKGGQFARTAVSKESLTCVATRGRVALAGGAGADIVAVAAGSSSTDSSSSSTDSSTNSCDADERHGRRNSVRDAGDARGGDVGCGTVVARARLKRPGVGELVWAPRVALTAGWDGVVRVWDARRRQGCLLRRVVALRWHEGAARCVTASSDGRVIASGGEDGTVTLWDGSFT